MELYKPCPTTDPEYPQVTRYVSFRASLVHGSGVDTTDPTTFGLVNDLYVMKGPNVAGYGKTSVMIAVFTESVPTNVDI